MSCSRRQAAQARRRPFRLLRRPLLRLLPWPPPLQPHQSLLPLRDPQRNPPCRPAPVLPTNRRLTRPPQARTIRLRSPTDPQQGRPGPSAPGVLDLISTRFDLIQPASSRSSLPLDTPAAFLSYPSAFPRAAARTPSIAPGCD